jgi:hypothetical protein
VPLVDAAPIRSSDDEGESYAVLLSIAKGQTGRIPADLLVRHAIAVSLGGDHRVREAALEALLRRAKSMDEAQRSWRRSPGPRGRVQAGAYLVEVSGGRSYRVVVRSFPALDGSCDCPDFARSSLGLCKHLFWLLDRGFDSKGHASPRSLPPPQLAWNPVRPLTGAGDWLERVQWTAPSTVPELAREFVQRGATRELKSAHADDAKKRLKLVRTLQDWARGASEEPRADPALLTLLEREEALLSRRAEGPASHEISLALGRLTRALFPYQEAGVRRFLAAGRLLLADDMGLGKTAQAIASCHVLHQTGRVRRGLVIVPASLKAQWLREWKLFSPVPAFAVEGNPAERARQYRETESGFLLVNYEQVLRDLPELLRLAPEVVVLDEAQRIKNWAAKTSLYVKQLQPAFRLVLTGTPLENRLAELASLMEWVDDLALEPKWRLTELHAIRADGEREIVGAKNLDTIRARLEGCTLRRIRKEVLGQLPPRTDTAIPVAMSTEQLEAHEELDRPIAQLSRTSQRRPLTQPEFLRLMSLMTQQRVICNGLAQRDFEEIWPALQAVRRPTEPALRGLFSPKLFELRELLTNLVITQGRKVVVFSQWKRMLRLAEWAVSDILADGGARALHFTGDESQKRRTQNVIDFHDDPSARVLFATDAGGVGLNLQRAASACVHLDLPWNPAVLEQRSGRIHRFGQKSPVAIYSLVAASGIESRIAAIVSDKKALFDGLFDGSSDEVRFEQGGSFLSSLQRLVEPVIVPKTPAAEAAADNADDAALDPPEAPEVPAESPPARSTETASPPAPFAAAPALMAGIQIKRLDDGRMIFEAQPEAATRLAALFEGFAALLRQATS